MARLHVHIPDELNDDIDALVERFSMTKAKVIRNILLKGFPEYKESLNVIISKPQSIPKKNSLAEVSEFKIPSIRKGESTWFELVSFCTAIGILPEDLESEIDAEDDILNYQNLKWISDVGLKEAKILAPDSPKKDQVFAWIATKS